MYIHIFFWEVKTPTGDWIGEVGAQEPVMKWRAMKKVETDEWATPLPGHWACMLQCLSLCQYVKIPANIEISSLSLCCKHSILSFCGRGALAGQGVIQQVRDRHTMQTELTWRVLLRERKYGKRMERERDKWQEKQKQRQSIDRGCLFFSWLPRTE